jgi:hypothetical protein
MDSQDSNSQIRTWQSSEPWQESESPSQDILTTGMKESVYPPTVSHVQSQGAMKPESPISTVQSTGSMKSQSQSQSQSQS